MGAFLSVQSRGGLAKRFARTPKALANATRRTMETATVMVEADLKRNALTGTKGRDPFWGVTGASGSALGVRSGHTRRSIARAVFTLPPAAVVGTIGSPLPQMKLHEQGGTVQGKPWLRIPTAVMQTAAGVDRLAGRSARTLPNTTIIKSRKGALWIAEVGTPRSRLAAELNGVPLLLYKLVRSVTLRPRRIFTETLKRNRPKLRSMFGSMFTATVRGS